MSQTEGVTFAETHIKTEKTYKSIFKTLGLDPNSDELKVYFVPAPIDMSKNIVRIKSLLAAGQPDRD